MSTLKEIDEKLATAWSQYLDGFMPHEIMESWINKYLDARLQLMDKQAKMDTPPNA